LARERACSDKPCLTAWYADRAAAYSHAQTTQSQTQTQPPIMPVTNPVPSWPSALEVSARQLYAAYASNEIAADRKYKGKHLAVSGTVMRVGLDIFGDPYISLVADAAGYGYQTVDGHFSKSGADQLSTFKRGDSVTLTCLGSGMTTLDPTLDCR
jgi:tRNA_anti-like